MKKVLLSSMLLLSLTHLSIASEQVSPSGLTWVRSKVPPTLYYTVPYLAAHFGGLHMLEKKWPGIISSDLHMDVYSAWDDGSLNPKLAQIGFWAAACSFLLDSPKASALPLVVNALFGVGTCSYIAHKLYSFHKRKVKLECMVQEKAKAADKANEIDCKICTENYGTDEHKPVQLACCKKYICNQCLQNMIQKLKYLPNVEKVKIACPYCKSVEIGI